MCLRPSSKQLSRRAAALLEIFRPQNCVFTPHFLREITSVLGVYGVNRNLLIEICPKPHSNRCESTGQPSNRSVSYFWRFPLISVSRGASPPTPRSHPETHVSVCGCGGCSLHAPYAGLRRAAGNCCRMIWRIGRTEGKAALSRRGGREIGGLSGRSVKCPGELLLAVSKRRKEGCGGGQPKKDGKERRAVRKAGGAPCRVLQQRRQHQR